MEAIVIQRFEDKDTRVQYKPGDILSELSEERFGELLAKGKVEEFKRKVVEEVYKENIFVTPKKVVKKGKK